MKSLAESSAVQILKSLSEKNPNDEQFYVDLNEILNFLCLHEELRKPILKTAAGITKNIDGKHFCLLDYFRPGPNSSFDISLFNEMIGDEFKALIDACDLDYDQRFHHTRVNFFNGEYDIIFALAHSVYGRDLLSRYWPNVHNDFLSEVRKVAILDKKFLFGQYKGLSLGLYFLLNNDILAKIICLSNVFKRQLIEDEDTFDSLNTLESQQCDFENLSLAFGLSVGSGVSLLVDNNYEIGERIKVRTLNAIIPRGKYQGQSVAFALAQNPNGLELLSHLLDLGIEINCETLNTIIPLGKYQGQSVAFALAENLNSLAENGPELLSRLWALDIEIKPDTLNATIPTGERKGESLAFALARSDEGIQLLESDNFTLGQSISKETMNHLNERGESMAFLLSARPEGRNLLAKNDYALGELITKKVLNTIVKSGFFKGKSVAYMLSKDHDVGKALLEHNNSALKNTISQETLSAAEASNQIRERPSTPVWEWPSTPVTSDEDTADEERISPLTIRS